MSLSISIVTMNQKDKVLNCLKSIYNNSKIKDLEVIVVDNNSSDKTSEAIVKRFPQVKLIKNLENKGFSKAHNQALKQSSNDFILVLNDDIIVKKNALGLMLNFLKNNQKAGVVGCRFLYPDNKPQDSSFRFPQTNFNWLKSKIIKKNPINHNVSHRTDYVMGAVMMFKRGVLEKVGLFDEQFFIFCEEIDLCYRIKKAGYQVWYLKEPEVIHFHGITTRHNKDSKTRNKFKLMSYNNMFVFYKKHYGNISLFFYKLRALIRLLFSEDELKSQKLKLIFKKTRNSPQIEKL